MRILVLLSYPQSGVNALHVVVALNYFTLVCNEKSIFVEMMNFAMVKVDTLSGRINWLPWSSNSLMEKTQKMLFPKQHDKRICLFGWAKRLSFDFVDPISILGFDWGICIHLLALSKAFRKLSRLPTEQVSSLLEIFTSSWRI